MNQLRTVTVVIKADTTEIDKQIERLEKRLKEIHSLRSRRRWLRRWAA